MIKYIFTSIFGFILGYIFFKYNYVDIHGPNSNIVRKNIYKFGDKYYKFTPQLCIGHQKSFFDISFSKK